jgi:hypothetical protein
MAMEGSTNQINMSDIDDGEAMDDLVGVIHNCLSVVQGEGSFAVFEPLVNAPNPGLYLTGGGGVVGLPISDRDA